MQEATQDALELQLEGEAERFFSQPPGAWEVVHDDWEPEPLSSLERVAMLTTAAPGMALLTVALTLLCTQAWVPAEPARAVPVPVPVPAVAYTPPASEAVVHERPLVVREPAPAPAPPAPVVTAPRRTVRRAPSAVTRARQLLDAGHAADARDLARSAIRSAPSKAAGYIVLAAALDKLGDRAGMKATFHSCVEQAADPLASACRSLAR
jgi:hypothetical protein